MTIFGFVLFLSSASGSIKSEYKMLSIASLINGIAVDSNANIYIGSDQNCRIQVFDTNGEFLYGFSFPAYGGSFTFGLDSEDTIHVLVGKYYQFKNGSLIASEEYDHSQKTCCRKHTI